MNEKKTPDSEFAERVRAIAFDEMSEGVVAVDGEGVIAAINPAAQKAFDSAAAGTVGRPFEGLLGPWVDSAEQYLEPDTAPETLVLGKDDGQRVFRWRVVPLGGRMGCLALMQDVTELIETEEAKDEFISFVSHELRLPLTSIKGYADLILTGAVGPVSEPQTQFLNTIRSNVNRMADQISYLVDVSRIEAGELFLDPSPVPLRSAVERAASSFEEQIGEKALSFDVQIPPLPLVWADNKRLIQIVSLLLDNAVNYTPEGGEIVVRAELLENEEMARISVTDSGAGISPEDQERIFEKFFRSDDQEVRNVAGIGLGLCIAKGLTELQGGDLWFESAFREGSTFYFTLPTAEAVQAE